MQLNLNTKHLRKCGIELLIPQGQPCLENTRFQLWFWSYFCACSWISPYLSLGFSLLVYMIRGLGLCCSVRLWLYPAWLSEIGSIKVTWQQGLVCSPMEPTSRTRGKIWLEGTEPCLLSLLSSCQVNQGYNCPWHTKHHYTYFSSTSPFIC